MPGICIIWFPENSELNSLLENSNLSSLELKKKWEVNILLKEDCCGTRDKKNGDQSGDLMRFVVFESSFKKLKITLIHGDFLQEKGDGISNTHIIKSI